MKTPAQQAYETALAYAQNEVHQLVGEKAVIEYRIGQLQIAIKVLEEKVEKAEKECQAKV